MLLEQIDLFADDDVLWYHQGKSFSANQLRTYISSNAEFLADVAGKKVALHVESPLDAAKILCLLDGVAESVLLLPTEQNTKDMLNFIQTTGSTFLLTDGNEVGNQTPEDVLVVHVNQLEKSIDHQDVGHRGQAAKTQWIIPTSGTTGVPKLVAHGLDSLTRTVKANRKVGKEYTWGLLYGLTRFAGLQVFLQCLYSGSSLVLLSGKESTRDALSQLAAAGCNALSATPTMWRKMMMSDLHTNLELKQITLGGEPSDQQVLSALAKAFPNARIVHIYASTEAGVGFAVTDGREGFPTSYLSSSPGHVQLKVSQDGFLLLKPGQFNQSYIGLKQSLAQEDGYINTGDLVQLKQDRYVFLGRANGAINVGGNKVQPEEVESVIRDFSGVKLVSVYAKSSPIMGDLVAADIVIDGEIEDRKMFKKELVEHCRKELATYKIPALIKFTDDIKLNHTGKILRS
ncbi:ANL family adenylate-forming protein [Vibrio sinaloensis]|uniref:ANL family adenylate-forming protein n=1 Tax=Photobacterium sp. (strain ATCC 43367) TaxID=379097 RepID=UPI0035EA0E4D